MHKYNSNRDMYIATRTNLTNVDHFFMYRDKLADAFTITWLQRHWPNIVENVNRDLNCALILKFWKW